MHLAAAAARGVALAALVMCDGPVLAQTPDGSAGGPQRWLSLQPSVSVTQTFTDNLLLSGQSPMSDAITQLTAGIALRAQGGRVRGYLDYALSGLFHARHGDRDTHQNTLSSALSADLAEGRARVDVSATISQAAVSAFGVQPGGGLLPNSNSTEQRALRVAPSFQGPLGPDLRYTASASYSVTDTGSNASNGNGVGNSSGTDATLHVEPTVRGRYFWGVDASLLVSAYQTGRRTEDDRLNATLTRQVEDLDLQLSANAGGEFSNQSTASRDFYSNWGVGANWSPSPRTRLSADLQQRYFGKSHALALEHRTALTVWRLSDTRSVSTPGSAAIGGRGLAYDLFFTGLASAEPDPVRRAALVETTLRSLNISPTALISPSFLSSSVLIQDQQQLSVALRGVRSAVVLTAGRTASRRADGGLLDPLAQAQQVVQRSLGLDLSHRLTPTDAISLLLVTQSAGGSSLGQSSRQRMLTLVYRAQPTLHTNFDLGLRRAVYANQTLPFDETAIFATLGLRF